MRLNRLITTIDTHTVGEPTRVITAGIGPIPGPDMTARKKWFAENRDDVRKALLWEPRGHRDMFGAVITEPTAPEADVGLFFMDGGGYLDMCGHGSIGAVTAILETGMLESGVDGADAAEAFEKRLMLDTPAGLIEARAQMRDGRCEGVTFRNQPAFWHSRLDVSVDGRALGVDIAYGGNYFGLVNAAALGLEIAPENLEAFTRFALTLRDLLNERVRLRHPVTKESASVALIEIYDAGRPPKNVVVFGAGQIDRSPCGTGTCAKMALLHKEGKLAAGERYTQRSILDTEFYGVIVEETRVDGMAAVVPEITGRAFITGFHQFVMDAEDPFPRGFQL